MSCAAEKDGGDDADITTGAWICAKVSLLKEQSAPCIRITGGKGVGIVTKPGLDQPIGAAAINRIPQQMIRKEVQEVCRIADYWGEVEVEIFVPDGEKLAQQTMNPQLGIVGGISILGTSGIVEPMSNQAILDTIRTQFRQRRAMGFDYAVVTPGNYGLDFVRKTYGYDLEQSIKCSNFIGEAIDMAAEIKFQKLLFIGHIGKLIKTAGGIMNTHSRESDCRMELLAAFAAGQGAGMDCVREVLACVTTEEAADVLKKYGKLSAVMERAAERSCYYLNRRAKDRMKIDCIMYTNGLGELARSKEAEEWFTLLEQEQERQI